MKKEVVLPMHGDLYGLIEFIDLCGEGKFNDQNGKGFYSDGRVYWEDEEAIPSQLIRGRIKYNYNFRYIIWFSN